MNLNCLRVKDDVRLNILLSNPIRGY